MSNKTLTHFRSASQFLEEESFRLFLEPSATAINSPRNCRVEKTSSKISSMHEQYPNSLYAQKKRESMQERVRAVSKQNKILKKKLLNTSLDAKALYKAHAIELTSKNYEKVKYAGKDSNFVVFDIKEPIELIKNSLNYLLDQNDYIQIKNLKFSITHTLQEVNKISVELESKLRILQDSYETKIKELGLRIEELTNNYKVQEKQVIDSLVEKNLQICNKLIKCENEIKEKNNEIIRLQERANKISLFHINALNTDESMDFKPFSTKCSTVDREEAVVDGKHMGNDVKMMKSVIGILEAQCQSKDEMLKSYKNYCDQCRSKISELGRGRSKSRGDVYLNKASKKDRSVDKDSLRYIAAIASALEDLLI